MGSSHGIVICIFGTKGGIGRTTIAANLAVAVSLQAYKTVLIDFDLHSGMVDQVMGIMPDKTIEDIIQNQDYGNAAIYPGVFNEYLSVLTSPPRPTPELVLDSSGAATMLASLCLSFDFVVVDLPTIFANHVSGALEAADFIGLLTSNDILSVKSTVFALQNLALLGYDLQTVRLIINQFSQRGLTEEEVASAVGLPIFWRIDRDEKLIDSLNKSKPAMLDRPKSALSVALRRLALTLTADYGKGAPRK